MPRSRQRRSTAWARVLLLTALVYATLPLAPVLWRRVARPLGPAAEHVAPVGLVVVGALVVWRTWRLRGLAAGRLAGLAVVAAAYVAFLAGVELTPAEKTHFLSYGLLAWFALRAVEIDLSGPAAYGAAVAVVTLLGLGDELVQGALPNRFFEWKDVLLNGASGALAVAAVALSDGPDPRGGPHE